MVSSSYMKLLPKTVLSSDTDNEVKESEEINGEQGRDESWQTIMQKKKKILSWANHSLKNWIGLLPVFFVTPK